MFLAETFHSAIIPIYYVTKIFGLTPFSVSENYFKKSRCNLIYSILLVIFLNSYTGFGLSKRPIVKAPFISKVTDTLCAYITQGSIFFGISLGCIYSGKIINMIEAFIQFDKKVEKDFSINLPKEYTKSKYYIKISLFLIMLYFIVFLTALVIDNMDLFTFELFGEFMAYISPETINTMIELQFCTLALCIKQRLKWLNERIVFIAKGINKELNMCKNIYEKDELKHRPITHIVSTGMIQDEALKEIEKIRKRHHDLCVISRSLNQIYSVQILFIVMQVFVTIIVLVYYSGKHLMEDEVLPVTYLIYCFFGIVLVVMQVTILVVVCSTTSIEAHKTGILIHNTISLQLANKCKEELQFGITSFSLQLLHQNVEFTACNIFVINETLLHSIIGAVTTYLIIVVQFELSDIQKLKNVNASIN